MNTDYNKPNPQPKDINSSILSTVLPADFPDIKNDELSDQITLLAAQINAATYHFLKLLSEFDRRHAWGGAGIRSCAHWLNWRCGIAFNAARERLRIARCLDNLPKINQAFAAGELSYSKVRAMTRVATDDNEEYLLMIAAHGTASHMEKLVRKYQRVIKQQQTEQVQKSEPDQEQETHEARSLIHYQDDDGMWIIHAKLPPEQGSLVVKAIDEITRQNKQPQKQSQTEQNSVKNVSAETSEPLEHATFVQQRADALADLAEHYIASAASPTTKLKALAGNERCQLMLHVDINTLRGHDCSNHSQSHLDQQWLSPQTAKRLSCDASLITVLKDEQGKVLNIGRNSRIIPSNIRRALDIRDETCRYPGCTCNQYVDFHHIKHWADGGETKLDNLVKLCRYHHRELHKGHFSIEIQQERGRQEMVFKTVSGAVIPDNPKLPDCQLSDFIARQNPEIDCHTGDSNWSGETMDYGMGVDGLLSCQQKQQDEMFPRKHFGCSSK